MKTSRHRFTRLGTWYILALSTIAFIIISGQVLVQQFLNDQSNDSRVVNVAGRQRMLSQKIAKVALSLKSGQDRTERGGILNELSATVEEWQHSREGLQEGNDSLMLPVKNSRRILEMFNENRQFYQPMLDGSRQLLEKLENDPLTAYTSLEGDIQQILENESAFLSTMDRIVFQYDQEARQKVAQLKETEYILLGISLFVILLEILFIFLPTTRQVNRTLRKLIESEKSAQKMAKEIGALYTSLEKSYEKISHINLPVENPKLYARADKGGNIKYVSELFGKLVTVKTLPLNTSIAGLFRIENNPGDFMDEVIDTVSEGKNWQGEIHLKTEDGSGRWFLASVVPVFKDEENISEILILGSDLTRHRLAEQDMQKKDRAAIERRINEQKFRSVLILEGQEEERKRIAMNIHDGIGQLITSLKYHIESLDPSNQGAAREKQKDINNLLKEIIQEVRRVTFNLKPPVLSDYGLSAGLKNFMQEVNKLTEIELKFRNLTAFQDRLPSKVENNMFRIVQEAVNNAIKYSQSADIEVTVSHDDTELLITVEDHGRGFDEKLLEAEKYRIESGHGFFNMFERTNYINGKLHIEPVPGKGTIVRLFVPLKTFEEIVDL